MTPTSSKRTAHKLTSIVIGIAAFWWGWVYMGFSEVNVIIPFAVALLAGGVTWRLLASRVTGDTTRD
jgi:hypothetical protein